jgi:hypothetical protein
MPDSAALSPYKITVPQALIDTYQREGAVLIPNPFESFWVDGMIDEFWKIIRNWEAGSKDYPVGKNPSGSFGIQNVILRNAFYKRWALESGVLDIVGQVLQTETVRFYFDNFFCKEGDKPEAATPLHHDVAAFGFKGTKLPSFWLALTDVDEDNAPLITYAGTQKQTAWMWRSPAQIKGKFPLLPGYKEPEGIPAWLADGGYERKVWTAKKGDVIMVNPYTIHGSLPRAGGPGVRIGFSSRWLGDDVRWKGDLYNEVEESCHEPRLGFGSAPEDEVFPVLWTKSEGNIAFKHGRFTTHITLEPRKGVHNLVGSTEKQEAARV